MSKRLQIKNLKPTDINGFEETKKNEKKAKKMAKNVEKREDIWYKYKVEKR